jgi:dTDP-4-dehydrorhamnose 3,5-epimerase
MVIRDTALAGTCILAPELVGDARGFFARLWSADALEARGLVSRFNHASVSFNRRKGTLRGMHYQTAPFAETKLVRCTRGAIYDVVLDLRPGSPTLRRWIAAELTAENRCLIYIPAGCAHGFQTLADDSELEYMIDAEYSPAHGRGVRWNDPAFGIDWPEDERTMSDRDRQYPDFVA